MLFDTHAHYYASAFDEDRDEVLSSLPEKGLAWSSAPATTFGPPAGALKWPSCIPTSTPPPASIPRTP